VIKPFDPHQRSTIEGIQLPQDTSAGQTLMLFSSPEPLLQGTVTLGGINVRGPLTNDSGACISPPE